MVETQGTATRVDSVMLAALAATDYPAYLIENLISSGGMAEVYHRMAQRRTYKPTGLDVADITMVVREVLDEISAAGLRTTQQEKDDNEQGMGGEALKHSSLFPVRGARNEFPQPIINASPQSLPDQDHPDVTALDVDSIKRNVTLLRVETLIQRWREGQTDPDETLDALRETLSDEHGDPRPPAPSSATEQMGS